MTARRGMAGSLTLMAAGSALVLLTTTQVWVSAARVVDGYPRIDVAVTGAEASGLTRAAALVALAGIVAVLATRGLGRALVGGLVAVSGTGIVVAVSVFVTQRRDAVESRLAGLVDDRSLTAYATEVHDTAWPYAAILGGLLILAGGCLAALRGRRWPRMGAKYDAPTGRARAPTPVPSGDDLWSALDRGEDPTR